MSLSRTLPLSKWAVVLVLCSLFCGDVLSSGLSPEEEHRLIMKADASVIDEKLKEMPFGVLMAPAPLDEHALPIPTMDPPLPEGHKQAGVQITTAAGLNSNSKQALSERIRNAMKTMKERMRTLQSSRSRIPKKPVETKKVPQFPRPSSLITSNPSDLEVAMKRIEIMASRAGFNMSSIPRRSQMQIVSRLAPKLPTKMSSAVKEELETMSGKIYHYLPEPARDPLIEDDQAFLQHFMDQFDQPHTQNDEFYKEVNSHGGAPAAHHQKLNSFDVSQVSLTDDPANEGIHISESAPSSSSFVESSAPNLHLMPPKFDAGEGESAPVHSYTTELDDEGVPKPSALISQYPTHHVEESDPLITLSSEIQAKSIGPTNASRTTKNFQVGSVKAYGHTTSSPAINREPPTRAPPTVPTSAPAAPQFLSVEDMGPTVSVPPKPIRVSVITKDSILVNDTSDDGASGSVRTIKYVHVEPLAHSASTAELSSFDKYLPAESISKEVKINPKEITVNIDKESLPRPRPSQLVLDTYQSTKDMLDAITSSAEPPTEDPYPLTDEEIAATVAELKKYEAEMAGLRQGENSLETDYPYRLLTPHPLEYPDHPDHPQPSSLEDDSDLVSHLDELLAEFNKPAKEVIKTISPSGQASSSNGVQLQATVLPSPASPPMVFRRPPHHPLLKHRLPHRPGMGRPMMMGSRLRPLIRHPPAGFQRPNGNNGGNGNPPRINEVTVSQLPQKFNKECDYFSDELCLLVQDYPIEAITEAMEQNPSVSTALLSKEPAHNQKSSSYMDGIPEASLENEGAELGNKHPDFAGEGGFLCPSKVAYGKIKKAKSSTSGDWKFIVNYGDKSQTLRLEKCLSPGDSCSYIMPHFRTACTQVYNYHRLLSWDSEKGLHMDVFKVPTCCTCHVLGYYVPGSKKSLPQSPAMPSMSMRRRDHPGPRFMGPPRPRRISHHMPHHGRKPMHPMMVMMQSHNNPMMSPVVSPLNVLPPATTSAATSAAPANTTAAGSGNSEDEVLRGLLLQYASLREKITKLKDSKGSPTSATSSGSGSSSSSSSSPQSKRSSKLYSHWPKDIIKALRKRKRQSTISSKNNKMKKPSPEMLKKLKNLLTNSTKLENNPKLKQKIQIYLRKLKNSGKSGKSLKSSSSSRSRSSRNMKMKLSSTASTSSKIHKTKKNGLSKADAKKRLMQLLTAAKKRLQDEKRQAQLTPAVTPSKQNRLTRQFSAPPAQPPRHSHSRYRQLTIPPPPPPKSHVNHESHPIWNYFHKLQGGSSSPSNRARRLRRLF